MAADRPFPSDLRNGSGGRWAWFRPTAVVAVIVLALAACESVSAVGESLDWKVKDGFVLAEEQSRGWRGVRGDTATTLFYVKGGETRENWTERAEVNTLVIAETRGGGFHWRPDSLMNRIRDGFKGRCPTDTWTVLHQDETGLLYEWTDIACPGVLDRHELVRIVMGRWYAWVIHYGIRGKALSAETHGAMIENLRSARVVGDRAAKP